MGFLSGIIGGVTGLIGISESRKERKAAEKYNNASLDLQRESLEIAREREKNYEAIYGPLEKNFLDNIKAGVKPNYEQVTNDAIGDVNSQFANSEAASLRQMQRMGVNPNSGRADALARNLSLSRALALSGTINDSRRKETQRAEDLNYARQHDAVQMGINKLNNAQSNSTSAASALAQTYANQASQSKANAAGTINAWADLGNTVYQAWDKYKAKQGGNTGSWL